MKKMIYAFLMVLAFAGVASAQTYTAGARVQVGTGILVHVAPSLTSNCLPSNAPCVNSDALVSGVLGTVQTDAPVAQTGATWSWYNVAFDGGPTGWVSAVAPYLTLAPPVTPPVATPIVEGKSFRVVGDYPVGPVLTSAHCILDGVQTAASMFMAAGAPLANGEPSQTGTIECPYLNGLAAGNHIVVMTAVNGVGSAPSAELQFVVSPKPIVPVPPVAPINLRIDLVITNGVVTASSVTVQ